MIRRPPRSTLFPTRRSSDLLPRSLSTFQPSVSRAWTAIANNRFFMLAFSGVPYTLDRKSTRLNSSHLGISYAVFCLKKKNNMVDAYVQNNQSIINKLQNTTD